MGRVETERTAAIATRSSSSSKKRLDQQEVDAAALEQLGLLREDRPPLVPERAASGRADGAGDEDVAARDVARVAGELHAGLVDRLHVVLEVVRAELAPVRSERVRLDQVGAGADEAEVQRDDALRGAQVRLLRTAKARDGARDEDAHAAVADERRPLVQPLQEPIRHAGHSTETRPSAPFSR